MGADVLGESGEIGAAVRRADESALLRHVNQIQQATKVAAEGHRDPCTTTTFRLLCEMHTGGSQFIVGITK